MPSCEVIGSGEQQEVALVESKHIDIPNPKRHYFFNYILESFEALIPTYLFEHLEKYLGDAEWREDNIMEMHILRLWERDGENFKFNWERAQEIEVELWIWLMKEMEQKRLLPRDTPDSVWYIHHWIRQAAMHRELVVPRHYIREVLNISRVLGHHDKADEMELVWKVARGDAMVPDEDREWVGNFVLTPNKQCKTHLQVLKKFESLMEEALFKWRRRENIDDLLEESSMGEDELPSNWKVPEDGDLRAWQKAASFNSDRPTYDSESMDPGCLDLDGPLSPQGRLFSRVLDKARDLRNHIAHRHSTNESYVRDHAINGILLCLMVDEQELGIEIEIQAEEQLTHQTRSKVLSRLREACIHDSPPRRNAILRVVDWENNDDALAKKKFYARRVMSGCSTRERMEYDDFWRDRMDLDSSDYVKRKFPYSTPHLDWDSQFQDQGITSGKEFIARSTSMHVLLKDMEYPKAHLKTGVRPTLYDIVHTMDDEADTEDDLEEARRGKARPASPWMPEIPVLDWEKELESHNVRMSDMIDEVRRYNFVEQEDIIENYVEQDSFVQEFSDPDEWSQEESVEQDNGPVQEFSDADWWNQDVSQEQDNDAVQDLSDPDEWSQEVSVEQDDGWFRDASQEQDIDAVQDLSDPDEWDQEVSVEEEDTNEDDVDQEDAIQEFSEPGHNYQSDVEQQDEEDINQDDVHIKHFGMRANDAWTRLATNQLTRMMKDSSIISGIAAIIVC